MGTPRPGGEKGKDLGGLARGAGPWEEKGRCLPFPILLRASFAQGDGEHKIVINVAFPEGLPLPQACNEHIMYIIALNPPNMSGGGYCLFSHLTDEKTELREGKHPI